MHFYISYTFPTFTLKLWGCPENCWAEIIPLTPDAGNAAEGKSKHNSCCLFYTPIVSWTDLKLKVMHVLVNNEQQEIASGTALEQLLFELQMTTRKGVAVAVNQEVVPRAEWNNTTLQENDNIMIITATQGG